MNPRRWLIGTPLPEDLAEDVRTVIPLLRSGSRPADKAARANDVILALTEWSLRYHFREPMVALGVGALTRKALDLALDLAVRGIRGQLRSVLNGFDDAQLARVADHLEERFYPDPHAG